MRSPVRKILAILLSVVLCVSLAIPSLAVFSVEGEPVIYTAESEHTREEIGRQYAAAISTGATCCDDDPDSYYSEPCSLSAPYAPGVLSEDTQAAMLAMVNYYRWLVGVCPLSLLTDQSESLQSGALARNFVFDTVLTASECPEDMDPALWESGAAAKFNLLGRRVTPRGAIEAWINEGYSLVDGRWDTVGHRLALLSASVDAAQFGYCGDVAIGLTTANSAPAQAFTAFPAPGEMPSNAVRARSSAWSVELNPGVLQCNGNVTATITDLADGNTTLRCEADETLFASGSVIRFVQPTPAVGTAYSDGEAYRVEISGLTDVETGEPAAIEYTVCFFDVREYAPTIVTSCVPAVWDQVYLPQKLAADPDALQKLASLLPSAVTACTSVGRIISCEVNAPWSPDPENMRWISSVDVSSLPEGVTDPNGVLDVVTLPWTVRSGGAITGRNLSGNAGESGAISVWRTYSDYPQLDLFRVVPSEGGWMGEKRFSALAESNLTRFDLNPLSTADNGDWFALYYAPGEREVFALGGLLVNVKSPLVHTVTFLAPDSFRSGTVTLEGETDDAIVLRQPNYPSFLGFSFTGVTVTCGDRTRSVPAGADGLVSDAVLNAAIAELLVEQDCEQIAVTAEYTRDETQTYRVSIRYQTGDAELWSCTSSDYLIGDAVKLTAVQDYSSGGRTYYFDHWIVDGKTYTANAITLRPNRPGEYSAVAIYAPEAPESAQASAELLNAFAETQSGKNKIAVTMNWTVPDGFTFRQAGFRVSRDHPTLDAGYTVTKTKLNGDTGTYTLHINMTGKEADKIYLCAYLIYLDSDGNEKTTLSEILTTSWNDLRGTK